MSYSPKRPTMRWSAKGGRHTVPFEMTSALQLRATHGLVRRRSSRSVRPMKLLVVLSVFSLLVGSSSAEQAYGSGYEPKPPVPFPTEFRDYQILPDTISPDQKFAFIYPKRSRLYELENCKLALAALKPFRKLSEIPRGHSNLAENARCYYAASWSKDSSVTVFVAGSRWGPEKVWVVLLRDAKVAKRTDLTNLVRQQVLPDYKKSRARRYNEFYDFVFEEDHQDTANWRLDDRGNVLIDTTCTTDPKELDSQRWAVRFTASWDIAAGKLTEKSLSRIPPRPNQTMQRPAARSMFPLRAVTTFCHHGPSWARSLVVSLVRRKLRHHA